MEVEQIPDAQSLEVIPSTAPKPDKVPTAKTITKIDVAVAARIEGESWEVVAPLVGRKTAASARMLTQEYPGLWNEAWELAYADKAAMLEGAATKRLVDLMNDADGRVAAQSCGIMFRHLDHIRPTIVTTRQAIATAQGASEHYKDKTKITSKDIMEAGLRAITKESVSVTTRRH